MALIFKWPHKLANGTVIGIIVRYSDPDGKKKDIPHYVKTDNDFAPGIPTELKPYPLFGLESYRNPDEPVFVVEGQKVQAALAGLGLQAVTSILGANNAGLSDWSPISSVRTIILLPDQDVQGERYIADVYQQICSNSNQPVVRIARLPNLKEKGDPVDWLKLQPELADWNELDSLVNHAYRTQLRDRFHEIVIAVAEDIPADWQHNCLIADHDWADPLPLPQRNLPPVPDLPEDLVPEALREGLKDIAWRMQVAPEAVTIALIVTIGSLIGSNCRVRPKQLDDWSVVPNLWGILIDLPGKLKSSALAAACTNLLASLADQSSVDFKEKCKKHKALEAAYEAQKSALREQMKQSAKTVNEEE